MGTVYRVYDRKLEEEDYNAPCVLGMTYTEKNKQVEREQAYRKTLKNVQRSLELFPEDTRALYMGAATTVGLGDEKRCTATFPFCSKASSASPGLTGSAGANGTRLPAVMLPRKTETYGPSRLTSVPVGSTRSSGSVTLLRLPILCIRKCALRA